MIAGMIKTLQEMQEKYGDIEVKAYITDCVAIQIKKDGN